MLVTLRFFVHLRPFFVGRCLALLPFQSNGVLATLRILVHYKILGRPLSGTTSLPEWGCACYAAFLRSLTETFRGLNSCICALTRNFLKAAVLHYFPSGVGGCIIQGQALFECFVLPRL